MIQVCRKCKVELPQPKRLHHFAVKYNNPFFEQVDLYKCKSCEQYHFKVVESKEVINLDEVERKPKKKKEKTDATANV